MNWVYLLVDSDNLATVCIFCSNETKFWVGSKAEIYVFCSFSSVFF